MENQNKLNETHPDLIEEFSAMTKEQLLERICAEVLDALAMEERVSVFMSECTINMSKTNYTPSSIRGLINEKQEQDISAYCEELIEMEADEMWRDINFRAEQA